MQYAAIRRRKLLLATLSGSVCAAMPIASAMAQQSPTWRVGDAVSLPPLSLLDGSAVQWPSLKGKVIVIEFWASWCPFCARQNPLLDSWFREHQSKGVEVITVSLDKTTQAAVDYMKKGGYQFKAGMVTPQWEAIYKQRKGLPQLFVFDRSGRLRVIEVREMMEEDIRELGRFL